MGVLALWSLLQSGGAVSALDGSSKAGMLGIAREVDGKKIAVDVSIWVFEASQQGSFALAYDDEATRVIKLVFERVCIWLRFGITPVLVLEGTTSDAKAGRLQWKQGSNKQAAAMAAAASQQVPRARVGQPYCQGRLGALHARVAELAAAMGLPVVQGAGEAEATCAALNAAGLVDGVHTKDSDALLFGAQTVYRTLKLSCTREKLCELVVCTFQDVRDKVLRLKTGGAAALRVLAALAGGDYNIAGVDKTGPGRSLEAVWGLLQATGADTDESLSAALADALAAGPDAHLLSLNHCTGCKTCGHETGTRTSKASHGNGGCAACGTDHGCKPKPAGQECQCEFHRRKYERTLSRVLARAQESPQLAASMRTALDEYEWQAQAAAQTVTAVQAEQLRWQHRPDFQAVCEVLSQRTQLNWQESVIRQKLRPVLIEWDLMQGPAGAQGVEWRPVTVQKVQGIQPSQYGSADADAAWRLVLTLERLHGKGSQQAEEWDRKWLQGELVSAKGEEDADDAGGTQADASDKQQAEEHGEDYDTAATQNYTQQATQSDVQDNSQYDMQQGTQQYVSGAGLQLGSMQPITHSRMASSQQVLVTDGNGLALDKGPAAAQKSKRSCPPPEQRTFRLSMVARQWPALIRAFQQAQQIRRKGAASTSTKGRGKSKAVAVPTGSTIPGLFAALASNKAAAGKQSSQQAPTTPAANETGRQTNDVHARGKQAERVLPACHIAYRQSTLDAHVATAGTQQQRRQASQKPQEEQQLQQHTPAAAAAVASSSNSSGSSSGWAAHVDAVQPDQGSSRTATSNLLARLRERKLRIAAATATADVKQLASNAGMRTSAGGVDEDVVVPRSSKADGALDGRTMHVSEQLGRKADDSGRVPQGKTVPAKATVVIDLITPPKENTVTARTRNQQDVVDLCDSDGDGDVSGRGEDKAVGGQSEEGSEECKASSPAHGKLSPGKRVGPAGLSSPSKRAVCRNILHDIV